MILEDATAVEAAPKIETFSVIKRNGETHPWNSERITRAIALAYYSVANNGAENPHRNDPTRLYGLDESTYKRVEVLTQMVERVVAHRFSESEPPGIEQVQDIVETCIATQGDWAVARCYVLYRERKAAVRTKRYQDNGLRDYIAISRYSRYREDLGRRELWPEAVERVRNMHLRRFAPLSTARPRSKLIDSLVAEGLVSPENRKLLETGRSLNEEIWEAFEQVKQRRVLPSMRSMQFGGKPVEVAEARIYNCSFSYANRPEFFRECFYLLLCGVGVGFSVQTQHVAQLPSLPLRGEEIELPTHHHSVADSIEGWADAIDILFRSHWEGFLVEFDYSKIRPRGMPIRTAGGKAPGHLPLKRCVRALRGILQGAAGRRLRPIEVYDCVMHIARAVLSGGIRRSATICLFSADDEEMANAKTGDWLKKNPQRVYSNNSAMLPRDKATREQFMQLFERQKEFGEPGFYFSASEEYGANPCVEIGLFPQATLTEQDIARLRQLGHRGPLEVGQKVYGWQMCNLTTINGAALTSREDFLAACRTASLIGTLQASFTNMPYLGPVTRFINDREALLGVSICGILDNPDILLNEEALEEGARMVRATNAVFANLIGINRAARCTCVKPEGTASLLLGAGSGIHPHHAHRYFRRVQVNRIDPVYQHFLKSNAHMTEKSVYSPDTDDVITFPVEAPEGAICRKDLDAVKFLSIVRKVQKHWVVAGNNGFDYAPNLQHNVSNTVTVAPSEWEAVADFIWENREHFTGVALLQDSGDKAYAQAPREEVSTPEDMARWNQLEFKPVDYSTMRESEDGTRLADVAACAGGVCEL